MPLMVGNVLRNLLHRPATRPYPVVSRRPFAGSRGRIRFTPEKCEFCGDCERACPAHAIVLDTVLEKAKDRNRELTWVRIYKPYRCIMCDVCVEVCAYDALVTDTEWGPPTTDRADEYDKVEPW